MAEPTALDVYVSGTRVGVLTSTPEGLYVFTYLPETPPEKLVSLTMPVRAESYKWGKGGVHPFFQMNLPEGTKKALLQEKLGSLTAVTDFGLLALTGQRTIASRKDNHCRPTKTTCRSPLCSRARMPMIYSWSTLKKALPKACPA